MNEVIKRVSFKFCVVNGILRADSLKMLDKAYGESVLQNKCTYVCCIKWGLF